MKCYAFCKLCDEGACSNSSTKIPAALGIKERTFTLPEDIDGDLRDGNLPFMLRMTYYFTVLVRYCVLFRNYTHLFVYFSSNYFPRWNIFLFSSTMGHGSYRPYISFSRFCMQTNFFFSYSVPSLTPKTTVHLPPIYSLGTTWILKMHSATLSANDVVYKWQENATVVPQIIK